MTTTVTQPTLFDDIRQACQCGTDGGPPRCAHHRKPCVECTGACQVHCTDDGGRLVGPHITGLHLRLPYGQYARTCCTVPHEALPGAGRI